MRHGSSGQDGRELGFWSLAAIGANLVIGAGFFVLPASFYAHVGAFSPLLIVAVGLGLLPVGLCFAELGSRFGASGGPYLYCRSAFGPFVGFQVNWLTWVTRVISHASVLVAVGIALASTLDSDPATTRIVAVIAITALVTIPNIVGVRYGAATLNAISLVKFVPIVAITVAGVFVIDTERLRLPSLPPSGDIASAALLMAFALSGFEMLTVPAREARDPGRSVPRALLVVLTACVATIALANLVCIGVLPSMATSTAPISDVSVVLFGVAGAAIISIAVVFAGIGHNAGSIIAASRLLSSAAEQGDAPAALGRTSRRFGTPVTALVVTALAVTALALSGSYEFLAATSAATRLVVYGGVALATLKLRGVAGVPPAVFRSPLAAAMPWLALLFCAFLLTGLTMENVAAGIGVLMAGLGFYALMMRRRRVAGI